MSLRSSVVRSTAHTTNSFFNPALAGAIAAALCIAPAHADTTGIQEVVVTAQKREETLQSTPIAMSALSADTLTKMGVVDFTGIASASPSIFFAKYPSASSTLFLFIRGQGNGDPAQITGDGAVGLYEDGIYLSRPQAATFDLADVERVETLRGPQGTLYGRNTTGGAINIITRKPSGEFGFKQDLSFGNRDYFRSLTTIDLPAWNDIATKLSVLKSSKDGFVKNTGYSHDFGEESQLAGRFALRWNASENFVADYAFESGDQNTTPAYYQNEAALGIVPGYSLSHSRTYRPFDLPESTTRFEGHTLTLDWDVSDALTFKSLTGYRELTSRFYQDYAEAFTYSFTTDDLIRNYQFSQEFQFIGSALDDQIKYAAGLYYFQESGSHYEQAVAYGGGYVQDRYVDADSKSQAVYAQATWTPPAFERLDLTVGGRYTKDKRDASRTQLVGGALTEDDISNSQDFDRFNPAFTANYRWTDDLSTYAKVATGYRAGGSSESGADFSQTYGPEKVTNYELGLKSYWLERRVRANAALFRMDYDDMQIATSPDASNLTLTQTVNAGTATIDGFELDLLVEPIDDLRLALDYAYLNADVDKVRANGQDLTSYYVVPFAPLNTYNASIDYTFLRFDKGDLAAFLEYRWQDAAFVSGTSGPAVPNGDYYERPSYGLLNGRITLSLDLPRGDHATIALWSKNLTDKEYKSHVIGLGDISTGYLSQAYTWGEPRSAGVDISYRY
jgi:iron complex outermembrane receptor protein